jgi:hypothetical protein
MGQPVAAVVTGSIAVVAEPPSSEMAAPAETFTREEHGHEPAPDVPSRARWLGEYSSSIRRAAGLRVSTRVDRP